MHVGTTYVVFTDGAAQHRTAQQLVGAGGATVYALTALTACMPGLWPRHLHGPTWQLIRLARAARCSLLLVAGRSVGRNASTAQHVTVVRGDLATFPSLASLGADRFSYAATTRMHGCTVRAQEQL